MMRRTLLLAVLSLVTLAVAACSDVTAPTAPERQIGPGTSVPANASAGGGYATSTGKR